MILGENQFAMLLMQDRFKGFTPKPIADAHKTTEALIALSAESRADVDRMVHAAIAAGGRRYKEPEDHGWMYGWGFEDLDGHIWEHFWMDPAGMPSG